MTDRVLLTVSDAGVADVRLNRPDKLNAVDDAMYEALLTTWAELHARTDVRVVVLSGEGRGFCAGLDLGAFAAMADGRAFRRADADEWAAGFDLGELPAGLTRGQRVVLGLRNLPIPVVAALHGPALGAGLQIALGAHVRIVAPSARLGQLEMEWGLTPDMAGTQLLPRLVGADVATELVLSARMVSGEEAVRIGLATRTADDPQAAAHELAAVIASRSPSAVRAALCMLHTDDLAAGLTEEGSFMKANVGSPDQRAAAEARLAARRRSPPR
ncbi:enoyl-CoA hydratase-related protein [Pseudonocardia sp. NPDC049154]|uniref:enoyl-CoA hydratase-related protein n=1 Tax=Pseudonocardia sp. NPDC049154 TaxID=3155501 RepID=UPI0033DF8213